MAFWDDLVRNLFGGGQQAPTKSKPKTGAVGRGLQRASRELRPSTTEAPAPQARARQQSPTTFSSVLSGGGGGGGGMRSFSRGNQAPTEKEEPKAPEMSPWDMFIYGQNDTGRANFQKAQESKYDFWDDLGAKLTESSGGIGDPTFWAPIAGAAERKEKLEQKSEDAGIKPGEIPSNKQLQAAGNEDVVNINDDLVPVTNTFFGNNRQDLLGQAAEYDAADARTELAESFGDRGEVTVRELTTDEWNALSPEQQKGVLSSWALYQASLADQEAAIDAKGGDIDQGYFDSVNSIFSDQGGSDIYAPNTIRVLEELGYQNQSADLDNFIDQSALPTYEDILGQTTGAGAEARQDIYSTLSNSAAFDSETISSALDKGQNLLDAIRVSGTVSDEFKQFSGVQSDYGDLTEEDFGNLNTLLNNLSNREVFARIGTDPELNQRLTDSINEANSIYGPEVVSRYFMDSVKTFDNFTDYMSPDEFAQNWLEG